MKFKKDKKKSFGWFGTLNPDAGNVELNNKIFNSASNASESPSTNPTGPMAEAKQAKYYDPEYDRVVDETVIEKQWEKIKASGYTYAKSYEEFRDQNFEKINESTDYDPRNYEIKAEIMLENEYGEDAPVELINKHKYYFDFEPQYILKYKVWVDEEDPDKVVYIIITTGTKKLHEFETEAEADAYWDKFFEDDDLHESLNPEYAVIKHYYDPRVGFEKFIYKVVEVVDETELGGIEYRVKGSAERGFVSKSDVVKKFNTKAEAEEWFKSYTGFADVKESYSDENDYDPHDDESEDDRREAGLVEDFGIEDEKKEITEGVDKMLSWTCWYEGNDIGTVKAENKEEAEEAMMSKYPTYDYNNTDWEVSRNMLNENTTSESSTAMDSIYSRNDFDNYVKSLISRIYYERVKIKHNGVNVLTFDVGKAVSAFIINTPEYEWKRIVDNNAGHLETLKSELESINAQLGKPLFETPSSHFGLVNINYALHQNVVDVKFDNKILDKIIDENKLKAGYQDKYDIDSDTVEDKAKLDKLKQEIIYEIQRQENVATYKKYDYIYVTSSKASTSQASGKYNIDVRLGYENGDLYPKRFTDVIDNVRNVLRAKDLYVEISKLNTYQYNVHCEVAMNQIDDVLQKFQDYYDAKAKEVKDKTSRWTVVDQKTGDRLIVSGLDKSTGSYTTGWESKPSAYKIVTFETEADAVDYIKNNKLNARAEAKPYLNGYRWHKDKDIDGNIIYITRESMGHARKVDDISSERKKILDQEVEKAIAEANTSNYGRSEISCGPRKGPIEYSSGEREYMITKLEETGYDADYSGFFNKIYVSKPEKQQTNESHASDRHEHSTSVDNEDSVVEPINEDWKLVRHDTYNKDNKTRNYTIWCDEDGEYNLVLGKTQNGSLIYSSKDDYSVYKEAERLGQSLLQHGWEQLTSKTSNDESEDNKREDSLEESSIKESEKNSLSEDINDVDLYTLDALSYYFGKLVKEEDISDYTADEIERAEDYYSLKDFSASERLKIFATKWKDNKKISDHMHIAVIAENVSKTNFYKITLQDKKDDRTWSVAVEGENEDDAKALSTAFIDKNSAVEIVDIKLATEDDIKNLNKVTKHPVGRADDNLSKKTSSEAKIRRELKELDNKACRYEVKAQKCYDKSNEEGFYYWKKLADETRRQMGMIKSTALTEDISDTNKLTTYYQIWAKGPSDSKFHFQDEYAYLNDLIEEAKGFMHGDAQVRVLEVEEDESGNIIKRNGEVLFYSDSAVQTIDKELFDVATPQETADMFGKKVYSKAEDKLYIPTGPVFEAARLSPEEKLERELEKLDKQASRLEARAERCFDKDDEEGGWYWQDQADEIRRQMDMILVTANLKEDYAPVASFYAIEFDDEYEDNLSRKEVREKALDIIKNNKAESIYVTKTSIYDQDGRQVKDFDDILEIYRDGEKWNVVLDKLSISKLADLETTEKDLTEDVDNEVELEYDDLEFEVYTGNSSGYFDVGFGNWLPDDSSKTVNTAYTYKVAQSDVEEFLYDFIEADIPQEELSKHIDDYDEFLEAYMKEHFDELFEKHKSKILDHFEEDAIDDASENYEDDDGYDYDPYDDYEPDYED